MDIEKINKHFSMKKSVIRVQNYPNSNDFYIECINKNSVAEKILDELRDFLEGEKYHFGLKTVKKYWGGKATENDNLVVYAEEVC